MRIARYRHRPHDNDDVNGACVHYDVDDDITPDVDDGDRAAQLDHVDIQHHGATHNDHQSERYDEFRLRRLW